MKKKQALKVMGMVLAGSLVLSEAAPVPVRAATAVAQSSQEKRETQEKTEPGAACYIDLKNGNDEEDGSSEKHAVKSLKQAIKLYESAVQNRETESEEKSGETKEQTAVYFVFCGMTEEELGRYLEKEEKGLKKGEYLLPESAEAVTLASFEAKREEIQENPSPIPGDVPVPDKEENDKEPSATPEPSTMPEPSEAPEPSTTPEPSEAPEPGMTPEPSEAPEPSTTPEPSATPEPSTTPEPSATPEPSTTPEPSATPEPSTTPEPSVTPEPSTTPEPSATPEPTENPDDGKDSTDISEEETQTPDSEEKEDSEEADESQENDSADGETEQTDTEDDSLLNGSLPMQEETENGLHLEYEQLEKDEIPLFNAVALFALPAWEETEEPVTSEEENEDEISEEERLLLTEAEGRAPSASDMVSSAESQIQLLKTPGSVIVGPDNYDKKPVQKPEKEESQTTPASTQKPSGSQNSSGSVTKTPQKKTDTDTSIKTYPVQTGDAAMILPLSVSSVLSALVLAMLSAFHIQSKRRERDLAWLKFRQDNPLNREEE